MQLMLDKIVESKYKTLIKERIINDTSFPKNKNSRHFSTTHYVKTLSNEEKPDRN